MIIYLFHVFRISCIGQHLGMCDIRRPNHGDHNEITPNKALQSDTWVIYLFGTSSQMNSFVICSHVGRCSLNNKLHRFAYYPHEYYCFFFRFCFVHFYECDETVCILSLFCFSSGIVFLVAKGDHSIFEKTAHLVGHFPKKFGWGRCKEIKHKSRHGLSHTV